MLSDKIQVKTPLRISWNLDALTELDEKTASLYPKVKAAFLFEFNLIVSGSLLLNGGRRLCDDNRKTLSEVNLVVIDNMSEELARIINDYVFRSVIVDWSDFSDGAVEFFDSLKGRKAVRCVLKKSNVHRLGELIEKCGRHQVGCLIFANPTFNDIRSGDYLLDSEMLRELEKRQSELRELEQTCKIRVHDLFCEEVLLGKGRREGNFAGCQAGLYLAYIDAEGKVYGCSSLPLPIGDINSASLEDIWQSEQRRTLRERIEGKALLCGSCKMYNYCKGGCRGLSFVKFGNFDNPDVLCGVSQ